MKSFLLNQDDLNVLILDLKPFLKDPFPILLLSGNLGAGKTKLTYEIAKLFNLEKQVTSPSFSIIQEYVSDDLCLVHMDFYRIKSFEDLLELGLDDIFDQKNKLIIVEWWDKFEEVFYDLKNIQIDIQYTEDPEVREYHLEYNI
jgi:tRNA threonylcarbamoyladenosine biosynthesis protein TsaE